MGRHVCALQHLRKAAEGTHDVFDQLERRCGALTERLRKAGWVVWVARHAHAAVHATHSHAHTAIHAAHAAHTAHASHATIHGPIAAAETRIWR